MGFFTPCIIVWSGDIPEYPIVWSGDIPEYPIVWSGDIPEYPIVWSGDIPEYPIVWSGDIPEYQMKYLAVIFNKTMGREIQTQNSGPKIQTPREDINLMPMVETIRTSWSTT